MELDTQEPTWGNRVGDDHLMLTVLDLMTCEVWECMEDQQAVNFVRSRLPPPGPKSHFWH